MIGETVSHYRILEKLGGGGMGVVYKALDLRLDRFVALKFLPPELTRDDEANKRFMQEARAASALDHPHICVIHEIDQTPDGQVFLTMAYYQGETLKKRIERGPLNVEEALELAMQIAQGLARAHESGIVHRDIKPANVMMTVDGLVKILDFGIAKLAGQPDLTRTGTTVGTLSYMSPEQIRGGEANQRADIWALGVVLYEMLTGQRPFSGDDLVVPSAILNDTPQPIGKLRENIPSTLQHIVSRTLEKDQTLRYQSAADLLKELTACRAAMTEGGARRADARAVLQLLRKPKVAAPAGALLVILGVLVGVALSRGSRERWAREQAIPEIMQLIAKDSYIASFALAEQAERYIPDDPVLAGLWPQMSAVGSLTTTPEGADVYMQEYASTNGEWKHLGRTPIKDVRLPLGFFRFRIEKEGFETLMLAGRNPGNFLRNLGAQNVDPRRKPVTLSLVRPGSIPGMVPVPGGAFALTLSGFNTDELFALDSFSIDRNEVTNREFKQFVDDRGYAKEDYWRGLSFVKDGRPLTWQEALAELRDSTGRPGPAAWELGGYPMGQDEYPVGSVSWYEAVAYCRSRAKALPTIFHWGRAAMSPGEHLNPLAATIIRLSNLGKQGPAPVGSFRGMGPYGTYDMAGNVREWAWNEAAGGRRWIPGGAWNDPEHMFIVPNSLPPFDRSAKNGFRCAQYGTEAPIPDRILGRVDPPARDHRSAKAVSDEVFAVFKRQFSYAKSPSNARVERRDMDGADWIREKISLDAGYENEPVTTLLFLPRNAKPPYQLVVYFPGLTAFIGRASSESLQPPGILDFIVKTGRALVWPVWKGSFDRWDPFLSLQGEEYLRAVRTRMFQWRQDLGKVLDTLSTRNDIDSERIAYLGVSFGASIPLPLLALEERLKVTVLLAPGFSYRTLPPEADAVNYVSRVKMPVLMLGGRHDYVFPLETSQAPLFDRLGTAPAQKRHLAFDTGHLDFPRSETIREVLAWLDRYLGPVRTATATDDTKP